MCRPFLHVHLALGVSLTVIRSTSCSSVVRFSSTLGQFLGHFAHADFQNVPVVCDFITAALLIIIQFCHLCLLYLQIGADTLSFKLVTL